MNYKSLFIIIFIFLVGCEENSLDRNSVNQEMLTKYKNSGFALIYDPILKKEKKITKKIDNRSLLIFHKNLKKNSIVKITNPINQKTVISEVISNKVNFSNFFVLGFKIFSPSSSQRMCGIAEFTYTVLFHPIGLVGSR